MTGDLLILKDVTLPDGRVADLTISDGRVSHIGSSSSGDQIIRCHDCIVLPAGIDMHVHLRDGQQAYKEDFKTGTMSALAGGVTFVVDQPNTIPAITSAGLLSERVKLGCTHALCRFAINGGVTPSADLHGMWHSGAMAFGEVFAGPSSYGEAIPPEDLRKAMKIIADLSGLMTIHAEEVTPGHAVSLKAHENLRTVSGEVQAVTDVQKMNTSCCRLHFCHLSSDAALKSVHTGTKEVTPHHLFLSYEQFKETEGWGKVNPPLRSEKVRRSLAASFDQIDVIASDHAPHTIHEKEKTCEEVPSGLPGVETMIPLLMTWYLEGRISLQDIITKTSINPATILGVHSPGFHPGDPGDFAIYPRKTSKISVDMLHSRAGWTPYEGMQAVFPRQVICQGIVAYDEGMFTSGGIWEKGRGFIEPGTIK